MLPDARMSLTDAPFGRYVRLIDITAGKQLAHRLAELGLTPGVQMMVVQDAGGPLLIAVRDSRIALGRGVAHKLLVSPI